MTDYNEIVSLVAQFERDHAGHIKNDTTVPFFGLFLPLGDAAKFTTVAGVTRQIEEFTNDVGIVYFYCMHDGKPVMDRAIVDRRQVMAIL